jgi:hypothetical protein
VKLDDALDRRLMKLSTATGSLSRSRVIRPRIGLLDLSRNLTWTVEPAPDYLSHWPGW